MRAQSFGTFIESLRDLLTLSPRMVRVAHGWHNGMTGKEIGDREGLSPQQGYVLVKRAKRQVDMRRRHHERELRAETAWSRTPDAVPRDETIRELCALTERP